MLFHVKHHFLPLILIPSALEQLQLPLIFLFLDLVEGQLVEIFEEPGPRERVARFGAEDVDARDGETGQLVAAGRFDVVEGHA